MWSNLIRLITEVPLIMNEIDNVFHPDSDEILVGRRLEKGDILQRGDRFASTINGVGWKLCHPKFFGQVIQKDEGRWCRPTAIAVSPVLQQSRLSTVTSVLSASASASA